jgi:hypothetical protein
MYSKSSKNSRIKNKRSQVMGQVFVYIFASFIFVIVLIYGYRGISKFQESSDYVAMVELKTRLRSTVNSIASSNSIERIDVPVPSTVNKICLVDLRKNPTIASPIPGVCWDSHTDFNPRICNSWTDNVSKNVFFLPRANLQVQVGDITIFDDSGTETGSICFNVSQKVIYLELEGMGDSTGVKRWGPVD